MTTLEIILIIIVWVFVGCFICTKRNWYKNEGVNDFVIFCIGSIVLAPIALIIAIFKQFIIAKWYNE